MLNVSLFTLLAFLSTSLNADFHEAKKMFDENNCLDCHNVEKFKYRKDKINNFGKLHDAVDACSGNSGTGWFEEEIMDVSKYLNNDYYKFKVKEIKTEE